LLEREGELAAIGSLLDDIAAGRGDVLVFHGPAGIGKSSLLEVAVRRASSRDFVVLSGRGGEMERDSAFGVVRQLFTRLLTRLPADRERALLSGPAARALPALGLETTEPGGVVESLRRCMGFTACC
jgi:predicted ATPase